MMRLSTSLSDEVPIFYTKCTLRPLVLFILELHRFNHSYCIESNKNCSKLNSIIQFFFPQNCTELIRIVQRCTELLIVSDSSTEFHTVAQIFSQLCSFAVSVVLVGHVLASDLRCDLPPFALTHFLQKTDKHLKTKVSLRIPTSWS